MPGRSISTRRRAASTRGGHGLKPADAASDIRIIDVEGAWRFTHEDLTQNQGGVVAGSPIAGVDWRNHGTAVLGEFSGDVNSVGIVGIASDAVVSGASHGSIGSAAAINQAATRLRAGDIILLEMHRPGPRFAFATRADQRGYIAVEWWPDDFAAIVNATSRGIIVVEAAGNGAEDLDDVLYQTPAAGFPAGWRNSFRRANRDSGAIVVGAGAPPPGTHGRDNGPDRSRLDFSNWGALIDAQGWGREVTTCGYGDLQGGTNEDLWYTDTFSGTSSASPIITGTIACLQGMAKAKGRPVLTPAQVRNCLRSTGSPQQDAPGRPATPANRQPSGSPGPFDLCLRQGQGARQGSGEGNRQGSRQGSAQGNQGEGAQGIRQGKGDQQGDQEREGHQGDQGKGRQGIQGRQGTEGEGKDIVENKFSEGIGVIRQPGAEGADEGTQQRLAALEQAVRELVHFIGAELRPDLSQSALSGQSQAAKDEKDLKDAEKLSEG